MSGILNKLSTQQNHGWTAAWDMAQTSAIADSVRAIRFDALAETSVSTGYDHEWLSRDIFASDIEFERHHYPAGQPDAHSGMLCHLSVNRMPTFALQWVLGRTLWRKDIPSPTLH